MRKIIWRVKLEADLGDGSRTEVEVGRIERAARADAEAIGLSLSEGKQISAAIQTEIVRTQASIVGDRFRCCAHCESNLSSKGYRQATFRSLFGDVKLRLRRFESCPCRAALPNEPRSFSAIALEGGVAPELAYVTAKFAARAPFGKVAEFLAELLPIGGAVNAGTVRNRTRRVGERIARLRPAEAANPDVDAVTPAVVIGLDGGYLRSRHRRRERNFEVIAGKVLHIDGSQHRFAFARNGNSVSEFANAIVGAGVRLGTPVTVLSDGDAGLWKLQRQVVPQATVVLDWWHVAVRFEHALQGRPEASALARPAPIFKAMLFVISLRPSGDSGTDDRAPVSAGWRGWRTGSTRATPAMFVVQQLPDDASLISSNIFIPTSKRWWTTGRVGVTACRFRPPLSKARSTRSCRSG